MTDLDFPSKIMNKKDENSTKVTNPRYLSIDTFRGFTIIMMVFVNTIGHFDNTPIWMKHAEDIGLTYVDLVAPFFIFAIALTYHISYKRNREKYGPRDTFVKFLRRYAALLGLGMLGELRFTPDGFSFGWGAVPSIGMAGIMTLLVINQKKYVRLIIGILAIIAYQIVISVTFNIQGTDFVFSDIMFNESHGGILGGVGYGIMLIFSSVICESFEEKKFTWFIIWGIIFLILGVSTHFIWGISKRRVSVPFILISIGLGSLFFYIMWFIYDFKKITRNKSIILQPEGKNSLFLYAAHSLTTLLIVLIFPPYIHLGFAVLITLINVAVITLIGIVLDKRKVYIVF